MALNANKQNRPRLRVRFCLFAINELEASAWCTEVPYALA